MAPRPESLFLAVPSHNKTVLNDYYTPDEYVNRRVSYLSTLRAYSRVKYLYPIARRAVTEVFRAGETKLSVQEVLRREHAAGFEDWLPLPTTENTETIDNFVGYGPSEWEPGISWPVTPPLDSEDLQDNVASSTPASAANASETNIKPPSVSLSQLQQPTPHSTADATLASPSDAQTMSPTTASTLASAQNVDAANTRDFSDPAQTTQFILNRLGEVNIPKKNVYVHDSVSALANRGMSLAVKRQPKRKATETPEPAAPPKKPRLKLLFFQASKKPKDATETSALTESASETGDAPAAADDGEVHCICGVMQDDGKHMVECEGCGVWQHSRCVRKGRPKEFWKKGFRCVLCSE